MQSKVFYYYVQCYIVVKFENHIHVQLLLFKRFPYSCSIVNAVYKWTPCKDRHANVLSTQYINTMHYLLLTFFRPTSVLKCKRKKIMKYTYTYVMHIWSYWTCFVAVIYLKLGMLIIYLWLAYLTLFSVHSIAGVFSV